MSMSDTVSEVRSTLVLAIPIICGQVSQMIMATIDSAMIGHVGTTQLAASAVGGSVFAFFYVAAAGLSMPVAVLVSGARGAQEPGECAQWLRHGAVVTGAAGVLTAGLMEMLGTQLAKFGQPVEVVAAAQPFFFLIGLSLIPALTFHAFRQFAESLGRPWLPMVILLVGVVLNVILNWILIYGHCGLRPLGLTGAGIATLTARTLALVAIWILLKRRTDLRAYWPDRWVTGMSRERLLKILGLGGPASMQLLSEVGAFSIAAWMMGRIGTTALAAHQIALTCASMTFMFPLGIAMASGMRVSRAIGAKEGHLVRPIGLGSLGLSMVAMGSFALIFVLCGENIARWFVKDESVVALAARLLAVAALFQIFDGGQVVGAGLLRGMQDLKVPTLITAVAYWCVMLPAAYWHGVMSSNPVGVWQSLACGLAGAAILLGARFLWETRHGATKILPPNPEK